MGFLTSRTGVGLGVGVGETSTVGAGEALTAAVLCGAIEVRDLMASVNPISNVARIKTATIRLGVNADARPTGTETRGKELGRAGSWLPSILS